MKSSKLALILTTLFSNIALESVQIVTVQTERIIKESQWGLKIQASITNKQKELAAPFEKIEAEINRKTKIFSKRR